jgi:probable H4MPT-linked C1 transfer pathway protein
MVVIELVNVFGLDIGGANTKATFLRTQHNTVKEFRTLLEYFPIWKNEKNQLPKVLKKIKNELINSLVLDGVGLTITAELSDVYVTKKEGVSHVLDSVYQVFRDTPLFILNVEANLISIEDAKNEPLSIASANWVATGWMIKQIIKNCIIIDVGSTSTSIIPIVKGKIAAKCKTDLHKLQNGELVYSGSLRTNVATIVNEIPVFDTLTRVSSELFAQSGDVHLLLGNIKEEDYTVETCDGRGKTRREAASRLARVVCADINMLTQLQIIDMAKFVYDKQLEQIAKGLKDVHERIKPIIQEKIKVVVTGLGRNFLGRKAAERAGIETVIDMEELLGTNAIVGSPSVGVALMVAGYLEGKTVKWKQS